jgi:hypothetical protein
VVVLLYHVVASPHGCAQRKKKKQPKYRKVVGDEVDERVAEVLNFVPQMKTKLKRYVLDGN